jgi:hypothetical protein
MSGNCSTISDVVFGPERKTSRIFRRVGSESAFHTMSLSLLKIPNPKSAIPNRTGSPPCLGGVSALRGRGGSSEKSDSYVLASSTADDPDQADKNGSE